MSFEDRLREARESLGIKSGRGMSMLLKINVNAWTGYEKGENAPGTAVLIALGELGFSIDYLITGRGTLKGLAADSQAQSQVMLPSYSGERGSEYVRVPRYNIKASAGGGLAVESERIVDYLAFKADWVRDKLGLEKDDLLVIEADGDSMLPTIRHGDLLLVNTAAKRFKNSSIYILNIPPGDLVVKRVERHLDGGVTIKSDNPIYTPETVTEDEAGNLHVVGQVIWHGGMV